MTASFRPISRSDVGATAVGDGACSAPDVDTAFEESERRRQLLGSRVLLLLQQQACMSEPMFHIFTYMTDHDLLLLSRSYRSYE